MQPIITLCTDFGTRDGYVAAMKGVILSITPTARIVDVTHDVARQSIAEGAFVLHSACRYFPAGTVHLAVIDPGVGTARRALAVQTAQAFFVAPDNGVLTYALREERVIQAVALTNPTYWLSPVSATFHGRDILGPVAAHLAGGVPLRLLGEPVDNWVRLPLPEPRREPTGEVVGHVIHVDRFGNAITDIPAEWLAGSEGWVVTLGRLRVVGLKPAYGAVKPGEVLALIGSHGYLEVAVREGYAAEMAGVTAGDEVRLIPA